jgi:hypothetical protein
MSCKLHLTLIQNEVEFRGSTNTVKSRHESHDVRSHLGTRLIAKIYEDISAGRDITRVVRRCDDHSVVITVLFLGYNHPSVVRVPLYANHLRSKPFYKLPEILSVSSPDATATT